MKTLARKFSNVLGNVQQQQSVVCSFSWTEEEVFTIFADDAASSSLTNAVEAVLLRAVNVAKLPH